MSLVSIVKLTSNIVSIAKLIKAAYRAISTWIKQRTLKKIEKKYNEEIDQKKETAREIESEALKKASEDSDQKLRDLHKKMK